MLNTAIIYDIMTDPIFTVGASAAGAAWAAYQRHKLKVMVKGMKARCDDYFGKNNS